MVAMLPLRSMFEDGCLRVSITDCILRRLYPWWEIWTLLLEAILFDLGAPVNAWTPGSLWRSIDISTIDCGITAKMAPQTSAPAHGRPSACGLLRVGDGLESAKTCLLHVLRRIANRAALARVQLLDTCISYVSGLLSRLSIRPARNVMQLHLAPTTAHGHGRGRHVVHFLRFGNSLL